MELAIDDFADGFEVDAEFSQDTPDERMAEAFNASWDRVHESAWDATDGIAVREHGCVVYVLVRIWIREVQLKYLQLLSDWSFMLSIMELRR